MSCLQNKSSAVIESRIHSSFRIISSSNLPNISNISSFRKCSNKMDVSNSTIKSKVFPIFDMDSNYQKSFTSNETCLTVEIADLIISEVPSFNISQKPRFKKIMKLAKNISKSYIHLNRKLISK